MANRLNDFKSMLHDIEELIMNGYKTKETYETTAIMLEFKNMCYSMLEQLGSDIYLVHNMMEKAHTGDKQSKIGPYEVLHYIDLATQLNELSSSIYLDNIESRQFVIKFPSIHCFQTIQFIIREDKLLAIANMRSCNFKSHLLLDIALTFYCAKYIQTKLALKEICTINSIDVIMNIGSLHIFKGE